MSFVKRLKVRQDAKRDASVGRYQGEDRVRALTGRRTPWDTEAYADQAFLVESLRLEPTLMEYEDSGLETGEVSREIPPPVVLLVGGIFFFLVAAVASIQLMAILGLPPGHRIILGVALEALLIVTTGGVRRVFDGSTSGWSAAGVLVVYSLFLMSAAIMRAWDLSDSEAGIAVTDWASAVLLLLAIAGPSWLAETCFRSLMDSAPARRQERIAKRELRSGRRRVRQARRELIRIGRGQRDLDQIQAQLRAIYDTTFHRYASGETHSANGSSGHSNGGPNEHHTSEHPHSPERWGW